MGPPKTRSTADDGESLEVIEFLSGGKFRKLLDEIVSSKVTELTKQIVDLTNEVKLLRESNADLIRLLTRNDNDISTTVAEKSVEINNKPVSKQSYAAALSDNKVKDYKKQKQNIAEIAGDKSGGGVVGDVGVDVEVRAPTRRGKRAAVVGSCEREPSAQARGFVAAPRKLHVYVGRCSATTQCDDIQGWLRSVWSAHEFEVTKLNSKGSNASFRIAAPMELEGELYDALNWPKGVVVKQFKFFRSSNAKRSPE